MRLFQTEPSLVPIKQFDGHGDQMGTHSQQVGTSGQKNLLVFDLRCEGDNKSSKEM